MEYVEVIRSKLKEKIASGMTQEDISNQTGITQSHISKLLSAKRGTEHMKHLRLDTFLKLFPDAQIVFGGENRQIGNVHHNTNSPVIQGDGNTVAAQPSEETASAFLQRIMAADDIDAETKVKIFNLHSRRPFN